MTVAEAIRHLEYRAQRRCDQHTINWSLEDVTAIRILTGRQVPELDDSPAITEQWAVIDRWWTDEPDARTYVAVRINDQEAVLRYNPLSQAIELVGTDPPSSGQ